MSHVDRVEAVLDTAVREATKGYSAAASSLIRSRVESCLVSALATCKEDPVDMHARIDVERENT
jgi:hypothetical protein